MFMSSDWMALQIGAAGFTPSPSPVLTSWAPVPSPMVMESPPEVSACLPMPSAQISACPPMPAPQAISLSDVLQVEPEVDAMPFAASERPLVAELAFVMCEPISMLDAHAVM